MPEYYGKISINSVCANNKYFAAIHGDGSAKSNVTEIAADLSHQLPPLVGKANFYTYDLQKGR